MGDFLGQGHGAAQSQFKGMGWQSMGNTQGRLKGFGERDAQHTNPLEQGDTQSALKGMGWQHQGVLGNTWNGDGQELGDTQSTFKGLGYQQEGVLGHRWDGMGQENGATQSKYKGLGYQQQGNTRDMERNIQIKM